MEKTHRAGSDGSNAGRPVRGSAKARRRPKSGARRKKSSPLPVLISLFCLIAAGALLYIFVFNDGVISLPHKPEPSQAPVQTGGSFSNIYDDNDTNGLSLDQGNTVSVTDLDVTPGLNPDWLNVLLLGADARKANEPSRTDTMMICSINVKTGEVKLSSIMRDTCVSVEGHSSVRINAAHFFGGAQLAMQTVNRYFGMNIEKYAFVDFNGFASIADALGGIDINLTENEMKQINHNVSEQYHILIDQGKLEYSDAEARYYATELKTYGENIHLDGMQTLGYARIRKIDSDYARTERQRHVLNLLLAKLKGADVTRIMSLVFGNSAYFRTNLELNDIVSIASTVLSNSSMTNAVELRLPVNGSYVEEVRGEEAMLYDMDIKINTAKLHAFIYS